MNILHLEKVTRVYPGNNVAVSNLDFTVKQGSICALLGPNGAGKTTVMRMICGLCLPTHGEIFYHNLKLNSRKVDFTGSLGVVSQHCNLELDLTAFYNLKIHSLLYNMEKRKSEERIDMLLKLAGIYKNKHTTVRTFSGGMQRKLQIIRALLHEPEVLILDEPTTGLDPVSREAVWDLILDLNKKGITILFSTHYMEEAQSFAHDVSIMHLGRIIEQGTPGTLINKLGQWCRIITRDSKKEINFFHERKRAELRPPGNNYQLVIRMTTLEDVFKSHTGKGLLH